MAEGALAAKPVDRIGCLYDVVKALKGLIDLTESKVITCCRSGSHKGAIHLGQPQSSDTDINLISVRGYFLFLIPEAQFKAFVQHAKKLSDGSYLECNNNPLMFFMLHDVD